MAMELGIDQEQIEAFKRLLQRTARDPTRLKFVVSAAILALGLLALARPQARRLEQARQARIEAQTRAHTAEETKALVDHVKSYEPRLADTADIVEWENYFLEKLEHSGATLHGVEPKATTGKGVFKVVEMVLTVQGTYEQLVDFIDRLERGERMLRLDRVYLERLNGTIDLECVVKGLVKPSKITRAGEGSP